MSRHNERMKAAARLIDAAPAMLSMLRKLRADIMNTPALDDSEEWTEIIEEIDALIEEASQ